MNPPVLTKEQATHMRAWISDLRSGQFMPAGRDETINFLNAVKGGYFDHLFIPAHPTEAEHG